MIREAAVSTPGKAIVIGEHAAVYGHPAILAALSLRLTAVVRPKTGAGLRVELPSYGFAREASWDELAAGARERRREWRAAFESGDGSGFEPVRKPEDLALIAAGELADRAGPGSLLGATLRIDSAIPAGAGCGSSAALAVAVAAALARASGLPLDDAELRRTALAVERQQHGRPSGVDVEAVMRGGVVWCRGGSDGAGEDLRVDPMGLSGLRMFQSGSPEQTTGDMVALVRRLEKRDPLRVRDALAAIDGATHVAREALRDGLLERLVEAVRSAERALESLGVVPENVARAVRRVEAAGGAAKISGAGGITGGAGLVLVVFPAPEGHRRFEPPTTWKPLAAELAAPGLRVEVAA